MANAQALILTKALKEEHSFDAVVKLILKASSVLKCTTLVTMKALLVYHNFKRCVGDFQYESYFVACACLSISIKFYDEPIEIDLLILTLYQMTGKPVKPILKSDRADCKFEELKKSLTKMECVILRMIEFCINQQLAHEYLLYFMNDFREKFVSLGMWDTLFETAFKLASDFYLSNKCLNFQPDEIAVTVIQFAMLLFHVTDEQIEIRYKLKWLNSLSKVKNSIKRDIWEHIFKICVVSPVAEMERMEMKLKICAPLS